MNNIKPLWKLNNSGGISFIIDKTTELPHQDHMAMTGQSVDMILEWKINQDKEFSALRCIRWPMLRTIPDDTKASLQERLPDCDDFQVMLNGEKLNNGEVFEINIHGLLQAKSRHNSKITSCKTIYPSVLSPAIIDFIELTNTSDKTVEIIIPAWQRTTHSEKETSLWGIYEIKEFVIGDGYFSVAPNETISYAIIRTANTIGDAPYYGNPKAELAARKEFINDIGNRLILETPNENINRLFKFSKLRATESIFSTRGGLMHGPGGYNKYLAAIWANDQAEYVNPFFPFLGHNAGNESALNSYRHFARFMNPEYNAIPCSIIAEGRGTWAMAKDRGDAAMVAYGAARFCLASGNSEWSKKLWKLIEWCLEYTRRQKNSDGVILSSTDELEGRFPAGDANLCTSTLFYDALISSSYLVKDIGKSELSEKLLNEANELKNSIIKYFSANVEGFETYQYYLGNDILRSWICIPLAMGIFDRLDGTINALFSPRLWTEDGLLTEAGSTTVWDRSTLYALRGILNTKSVDKGLEKLEDFTIKRLIGDHVPYVIEAYPEHNKSHLSAESGLYCRIFTEGLFGIRATGLNSFNLKINIPAKWNNIALKNIYSFGRVWNLIVTKVDDNQKVTILDANGKILYESLAENGSIHSVNFSKNESL